MSHSVPYIRRSRVLKMTYYYNLKIHIKKILDLSYQDIFQGFMRGIFTFHYFARWTWKHVSTCLAMPPQPPRPATAMAPHLAGRVSSLDPSLDLTCLSLAGRRSGTAGWGNFSMPHSLVTKVSYFLTNQFNLANSSLKFMS